MNKRRRNIQMQDYDPEKEQAKPQPKQPLPPQPISEHPIEETPVQAVRRQQQEKDDHQFEVISDLPTGGKLYPKGTVIKARPMKVAEVKMLAGMTENSANNIVNDIVARTTKGIDIKDMFTADKVYIMFWLRANTYKESGYQVNFECSECNSDSTYIFELDKLNIKELTDENVKKLEEEIEIPNGDTFTFKLLTVQDEDDNEKFLKQNRNSMMNFDEEIVSICRMIDTINGKKRGMIDKYMHLTEKLSASEYVYLESLLEKSSVGLEPTIDVKCQKCGGASETMLPFRPDFFFPKVRV